MAATDGQHELSRGCGCIDTLPVPLQDLVTRGGKFGVIRGIPSSGFRAFPAVFPTARQGPPCIYTQQQVTLQVVMQVYKRAGHRVFLSGRHGGKPVRHIAVQIVYSDHVQCASQFANATTGVSPG